MADSSFDGTTAAQQEMKAALSQNETNANPADKISSPPGPLETKSDIGIVEYRSLDDPGSVPVGAATAGRANAFAALVKGWESYMKEGEMLQPLQRLQDQFSGQKGEGLPRLMGSMPTAVTDGPPTLAPHPMRHSRSSPLQPTSSRFSGEDDCKLPPPIPLDPFQRSSSTPSAFRTSSVSSAFGTADSSAFTLPSQKASFATWSDPGAFHSAFDPVTFYTRALEDMERTAIEVSDVRPEPEEVPSESSSTATPQRKGAASRAARFLADVRVLRRRRRPRGGRVNPAQPNTPPSDSKPESVADDIPLETTVTVITETDVNVNDTSMLSQSSEVSAIFNGKMKTADDSPDDSPVYSPSVDEIIQAEAKAEVVPCTQPYQQLDSDVDEEEEHYHRLEALEAQIQTDSPGTIPSPSYQHFVDSPIRAIKANEPPKPSLRIRLSSSGQSAGPTVSRPVASPSPTPVEGAGIVQISPQSQESAMARSAATGSSSGHTTQATSLSLSTGVHSGLSTISETDREVMEANKEGKLRRGLESLQISRKSEADCTSVHSSSTNTTPPHGYLALASSPASLREGANVPIERFFLDSPTSGGARGARSSTASFSSRKSGSTSSQIVSENASLGHTSSSSSSREEPPTFVSYLDREASSDLTSLREATESSSPREFGANGEEREGSPAEILEYPEVLFEAPKYAERSRPKIVVPLKKRRGRLDKFRLPPRSPVKGLRPPMTPPPRNSVSPLLHQHSPPRNIVDHPHSNISRPSVKRTTPVTQKINLFNSISSHLMSLSSSVVEENHVIQQQTSYPYSDGPLPRSTWVDTDTQEPGIEIMKADSKDEGGIPTIVTPEKDGRDY